MVEMVCVKVGECTDLMSSGLVVTGFSIAARQKI